MVLHAHHHGRLEAGLLTSTDKKAVEKASGSLPFQNSSFTEERPKERMSSPRRLMLTVLVCFLVSFGLASVLHHSKRPCLDGEKLSGKSEAKSRLRDQNEEPESSFAHLLRSASPDILHRLLHAYFPDRYQHGVFPSDYDALAAVHMDNALLATTLARLARRQDGGTNSTDTTPPDTNTDDPATDLPDPTPDPPASNTDTDTDTDPPQTNGGGGGPSANTNEPPDNTPGPTPEPTQEPTPTEEPDNPGTSPQGEPSDEPPPDEPPSSSPDTSDSSDSDSPPDSSPDSLDSDTPPDASDSDSPPPPPPPPPSEPSTPKQTTPPKTTRTPSKSASAVTKTSTLPDGRLVTVTSTSYYDVYPAEETDPAEDTALQNVGSNLSAGPLVPVLLGLAIGVFWFI